MNKEIRSLAGSREQLLHLLAEAAEIEHMLMCSYLYAAFSLKRAGDPGVDDRQGALFGSWRKAVVEVAVEEMVHLVEVANLTIAIGGGPHFGRPNFPVEAGYFPSGVVVRLTPFSIETLDHFIHLERPKGVDEPDAPSFEADRPYERGEAYLGLMPSLQDYDTVGGLYATIKAGLRDVARRIGEDALFIGPVAGQVGSALMGLDGVMRVGDLTTAIAAIDPIVEQGEGSAQAREGSHYSHFLEVRAEYERELSSDPNFAPAWPAASNPVMHRPPDPGDKVYVDDPAAARVLDLSNAVYALILRLLVLTFGHSDESMEDQARYLDAAVGLMHVLGETASALAVMPASASHPGVNAGMTFTMLRSVAPLFGSESAHRLIYERLRELIGGAEVATRANPRLSGLPNSIRAVANSLAK